MQEIIRNIGTFLSNTGIAQLFRDFSSTGWKTLVMYGIIVVLFYLAVVKKFEPMLLLPIAFGMLLANLPGAALYHSEFFFDDYYVSFAQATAGDLYVIDGFAIHGTYAREMYGFLTAITEAFGPGIFSIDPETLSCTFDLSFKTLIEGLDPEAAEALIKAKTNQFSAIFADSIGSFAKIKEVSGSTIIQVKMSTVVKEVFNNGGLVDILYLGVKFGIYPSLIFLGIGAMTDFSPLIANPKSLILGAAAQFGVFAAFFFALTFGFSPVEAASIGIIGGADGPTAILVTKTLAPHLLGAIAIAAYSYMALIPMIQPPVMKLLTTKRERSIVMTSLRPVSKAEKVIFPILVTLLVVLIVPDAAPLVGFLMLGNLFNVSGVTDRLSKTGQNELINIITIFLGVSVGATASAENFLAIDTLLIIALGLFAFILSTMGGLLFGKLMCFLTNGKINPLIGSAGVSAVPMAARVAQDVGRRENPSNFLLMHAMGPNVAGVIGSAVAAGVFLTWFG